MSPMRVTFNRTIGMVSKTFVSALSISLFLAGAAALFAFNLDAGEGGFSSLASIWTISVSPVLPALAALLGMEVWSDERKTGRLEMLLSSPVKERSLVAGKFFGVWLLTFGATVLFLMSSLLFLKSYAPGPVAATSLVNFIPGLFLLAVQSALWSAVAVAASALFKNSSGAAAMTIFILVALPRALWLALSYWADDGRTRFGELPMDVHAFDFASGLVSVGVVLSYALLTLLALFIASKTVASFRFTGRTARRLSVATDFSLFLAVLFSVLAIGLVYRVDVKLDIPVAGSGETAFSAHTRAILEQARGSISITAFLERKDSRFRHVSHFLRSLKRNADEIGGVRLEIKHVDPVLDIGEATRLVREGVKKSSFVFKKDDRIVETHSIDDGYGERFFAAMIDRIAVPFHRSCIYWTTGHAEASFDDYSSEGMSDIARELSLNGYDNKKINLADAKSIIGKDCALLVIAGPKKDFAEGEIERLRAYLDGQYFGTEGGRVLVLTDSFELRGLANLLSVWGIRSENADLGDVPTMSGGDVIVRDFSESHPVTSPLKGQQVIFFSPIAFSPSSSACVGEGASPADLKRYGSLLNVGGASLAAVVERGCSGSDLAIRPSRLIAIGDVGFVMNGSLRANANANRDFFLNSVKYLSGRDAMAGSGLEADRLITGMDRNARISFAAVTSAAVPASVFILYALLVFWRRRRR